ncbi:MAG: energy transducer TonB [Prevotella sp.]|jgi:protein TonB|nr:energy transducer TonB [Prevotella sp.]
MKKLILMSVMIACCFLTANAQKTVVSQNNQKVYEHPEVMPEYPGGMSAMVEFLSKNVKYPKDAAKQKVEGRVLVWFVVETDGSLTDVKVAKKVFPSLDAEAVRVVKTMPKWTPGKHNDQPVRVRFALPIVFKAK